MAEHFEYTFEHQLSPDVIRQGWDRYKGLRPLDDLVAEAAETVTDMEQFQALPERNQQLLLDMSRYMIKTANQIKSTPDNWYGNDWGLYLVGSRSRGDQRPDSDLDLLSAGTFYRHLGFRSGEWVSEERDKIFDGFDIESPSELPGEYNVGLVDRKYLLRATPRPEHKHMRMIYPKPKPVLAVDLSVVDLTFIQPTLEEFTETLDVDEDQQPLVRVPLVELHVEPGY